MRCLNHPQADATDSCMLCKNFFCERCLEAVGERKACLDCMEAMAESSLAIQERSFLPIRLLAAGATLLLLGLFSASENAIRLVSLVQAVFLSKALAVSIPQELASLLAETFKTLTYLVSGYGVLMSRRWSYWLGLGVAAGTLLFEVYVLTYEPNRFGLVVMGASAAVLVLIASGWGGQGQ